MLIFSSLTQMIVIGDLEHKIVAKNETGSYTC